MIDHSKDQKWVRLTTKVVINRLLLPFLGLTVFFTAIYTGMCISLTVHKVYNNISNNMFTTFLNESIVKHVLYLYPNESSRQN